MLKLKLFWVIALVIMVNVSSVCSQSPQAGAEQKKSSTQFVVGTSAVLMPQGYFLLIRKGQKIGAVRFTSIEQGGKSRTGKASYESYFQSNESLSFISLDVRRQVGEINVKPLKGFHPLAFQFGKTKVKVGEWAFECYAPGLLFMFPYARSEKDYGYEFAPTSAQSVEGIDASDKRLKWFRFNANERVEVSVSDFSK